MASLSNLPNGVTSFGVPVLPSCTIPFSGTSVCWFVDPYAGADGNDGRSPSTAFQTLYRAQIAATAGQNDVVFLIGNMTGSTTSGTARLSLANAIAANAFAPSGTSTPTTGTLTWAKNAVHLIGVAAPGGNSRARIAPPNTTYTQATFNSGNFVNVTAQGCQFINISCYNGFTTGGINQIAWQESGSAGGRNYYYNCDFLGMEDAASAADTGSRSLKLAGIGESIFERCQIGSDTTTRSVANASLELANGVARNQFIDCVFPFQTSNAGVLGILGTGASCVDRWNRFVRCSFVNNIKSTSTQMTVLASMTSASPGGLLQFKNCDSIGITKFGDTNALANSYIDMPAVSAAAGGLDVNPS